MNPSPTITHHLEVAMKKFLLLFAALVSIGTLALGMVMPELVLLGVLIGMILPDLMLLVPSGMRTRFVGDFPTMHAHWLVTSNAMLTVAISVVLLGGTSRSPYAIGAFILTLFLSGVGVYLLKSDRLNLRPEMEMEELAEVMRIED